MPYNPYDIALQFCLEKTLDIARQEKQEGKKIHLVFERRGKKEDNLLELVFRRITDNNNNWGYKKPNFKQLEFEIKFVGKNHNSTELQLADLMAKPIGLVVLKPEQTNRAYKIIMDKGKKVRSKEFPE